MSDAGTAYVIEILGLTLAERDQQLAAERGANSHLVEENNALRRRVAELEATDDDTADDKEQ